MKLRSQRGVTIVENLVSMAILSIALVGSTSLFISSYHSDAASRGYGALIADVHSTIDGFRSGNFSTLLNKFSVNFSSITNNQTATETIVGKASHATYTVTYTAIRTSSTTIPEAVKVGISAAQRRGNFGTGTFTFETIIAQTK